MKSWAVELSASLPSGYIKKTNDNWLYACEFCDSDVYFWI